MIRSVDDKTSDDMRVSPSFDSPSMLHARGIGRGGTLPRMDDRAVPGVQAGVVRYRPVMPGMSDEVYKYHF